MTYLFDRSMRVLVLGCMAAMATGAGAVTLHGKPPQPEAAAVQKLVLPSRAAVLTIDWIDAKATRIAIGGRTYALRNVQPRIVLADGSEATHIGYLHSGQSVRIATAQNADGTTRLVEIRVVAA